MTWLLILYFNSASHNILNYEVQVGQFATYEDCSKALADSKVTMHATNGLTNTTKSRDLPINHGYCKPQQ